MDWKKKCAEWGAKAKKLLQAFGGIRGVKSAEKEQLEAVAGISRENAAQVWSYFHKKEEAKEETP